MEARLHAVVRLDSDEARIFQFTADDVGKERFRADMPHRQIVHRARSPAAGPVRDDREYFEAILAELTEVDDWLIIGPSEAGRDFEKYVRVGHAEALAKKLIGVEVSRQSIDSTLPDHALRRFSEKVGHT